MPKSIALYEEIVEITSSFLGPAAERFVERQIQTHLKMKPEKLTRSDLKKILDWIHLSMSHLTDDDKAVDEYVQNLDALTRQTKYK